MDREARVYVSGMKTLMGSALLRVLRHKGHVNLVGTTEQEPDPTDLSQVDSFFACTMPEYVLVASGKSGGIRANQKFPAMLMLDNLLGQCHIIHSAYRYGVKKLLFLASSCCYPRECRQPMQVESLLTGHLEPSNEAYALAKIAGMRLCQAYAQQHGMRFVSVLPADAFGPGDDFSSEDSHVVPALIRRMHEAKIRGAPSVEVWGTGRPRRELAYADDLADACVFVMDNYEGPAPINLGGGTDVSVAGMAAAIKETVGYSGKLRFDSTKPDGMPIKVLDSSRLRELGWRPRTELRDALRSTYDWFLKQELSSPTGTGNRVSGEG